ncbi:MAG: hypothetical protein ACOY4H_06745 [Thermodesulfobacteriota bacterium]
MSHKQMIWKEFKRAGLLDSSDEKIQGFLRYLKGCRQGCWEDIIPEFKEKYYDCFDAVVPVLAAMDDPLIQMVLAKHADATRPKEKALLEKMARETDVEKNPVVVKRIAGLKIASVDNELKKRNLPENLRKYVGGE